MTPTQPEAPSGPGQVAHRGRILLAVTLGSGIVFLDGTIVNVALETIGRELPSTVVGRLEGLTYVTGGYLAVLAALLVLAGALSDRLGRRRVFRLGLIGFGVMSTACGVAPNMEVLILARLLQGAAGALLVPGALSIITATFSGEERGRAIGAWAAATSALTTLGPLVGGLLVQGVSWRAAFLVNLPVILVALWALEVVPESSDPNAPRRFDWLGAMVIVLAVGGLAFGATRGQEQSWHDPLAFAALGIGAVALLAFPFLMAFRPDPLVPLGLFRTRNFAVVNLATLVIYAALYVSFTFQSLFLQGTLAYSPVAAGTLSIPTGVLLSTVSTYAGRLAGRIGPRPFMVAGPLLMAAGLLWLVRIPSTSTAWAADPATPSSLVPPGAFFIDVLPAILLFGMGLSLLVAPLTTALMSSLPVARAGLGSAINNAVSRVGAPLASAALFIAITATFLPSLESRIPGLDASSEAVRRLAPLAPAPDGTPGVLVDAAQAASTDAFHLAMLVAASLLVIGAVVSLLGLERPGRPGADGAGVTTEGGPEAVG